MLNIVWFSIALISLKRLGTLGPTVINGTSCNRILFAFKMLLIKLYNAATPTNF